MKIKELFEQKGKIIEQMRDLAKQIEETTDPAVAKEKRDQFDKFDNDLEEINDKIRIAKRAEEVVAQTSEVIPEDKKVLNLNSREEVLGSKEYRNAFEGYLRYGATELNPEGREILAKGKGENITDAEARANQFYVGTAGKGGYLVPTELFGQIITAQKEFGGMLDKELCYWLTTSKGGTLTIPVVDDTSVSGYLIAEKTDMSTSASDMTFATQTLNDYKYTSGLVKASRELLQDSAFPFASWLIDQLMIRLNRGLNTAFTTGTGSSQPQGVMGASSKGEDATKRALTRDDILNLQHSVDPAYRRNGTYMFNDSTLKTIKALAVGSSDARPLWQPSMREGEPDKIEGKNYVINQDMEDIHPTYKPVLFGDFKYFAIREVLPFTIIRLDELYAATDEVGFTIIGRYDSELITNGTPLKFIRNATT